MFRKRRRGRTALIVVGAIALIYLLIALMPPVQGYKYDNPFIAEDKPLVFAHRGGSDEFPENTLEAYYHTTSILPDAVLETDVRLTKDGVLILLHDGTLDSNCDRTGEIKDITYEELLSERVNFGYDNDTEGGKLVGEMTPFENREGIVVKPTDINYPEGVSPRDEEIFLVTRFDELLTAFPNNLISVEIKDEERGVETLHELLRVIGEHDAFDRVLVASFIEEVVGECKRMVRSGEVSDRLMYTVALAPSIGFIALQFFGLDSLFYSGAAAVHYPTEEFGFNLAKKSLVKAANEHNIAVHYFTIDDKEEMEMLIEIGADGIMTDNPTVIDELYRKKN